jgi:hypothetical protein
VKAAMPERTELDNVAFRFFKRFARYESPLKERDFFRVDARTADGLTADAVHRLELHVHPLVLALMSNSERRTGLEAKLSVHHCASPVPRWQYVFARSKLLRPIALV